MGGFVPLSKHFIPLHCCRCNRWLLGHPEALSLYFRLSKGNEPTECRPTPACLDCDHLAEANDGAQTTCSILLECCFSYGSSS